MLQKIRKALLFIALWTFFLSISPTQVLAGTFQCQGSYANYVKSVTFDQAQEINKPFRVTVEMTNQVDEGDEYYVAIHKTTDRGSGKVASSNERRVYSPANPYNASSASTTFNILNGVKEAGTYEVVVRWYGGAIGFADGSLCKSTQTLKVEDDFFNNVSCSLSMPSNIKVGEDIKIKPNATALPNFTYVLRIIKSSNASQIPAGNYIYNSKIDSISLQKTPVENGVEIGGLNKLSKGNYIALIEASSKTGNGVLGMSKICTTFAFDVSQDATNDKKESKPAQPTKTTTTGATSCGDTNTCVASSGVACNIDSKEPPKNGEVVPQEKMGVYTAIGCVPVKPEELARVLLRVATGLGGGIALLMMISGAFQMITAVGNPESVKKGQEKFSSAVMGLLFIIFSVLLMEIIGVDILGLPGFGR